MIANFHDSVKNHCYDRGKGCTSNLEVQPSWGIVFIWILVNSFWCRQLLPLFFVYPPPFVSFDAIVKKLSGNDNRPVTK